MNSYETDTPVVLTSWTSSSPPSEDSGLDRVDHVACQLTGAQVVLGPYHTWSVIFEIRDSIDVCRLTSALFTLSLVCNLGVLFTHGHLLRTAHKLVNWSHWSTGHSTHL